MEQKQVLLPALALGLGVGLGLGVATGRSQAFHNWNTVSRSSQSSRLLELELTAQVMEGKESNVTFDQFPYYLNQHTRVLLTNAAYVHLKQVRYAKYTRNLSPASKALLLTGPTGAEAYHQMLVKALAHCFEAKLLLLDVIDFSLKMQTKFEDLQTGSDLPMSSRSLTGSALQFLSRFVDSVGMTAQDNSSSQKFLHTGDVKLQTLRHNSWNGSCTSQTNVTEEGDATCTLRRTSSWPFEDKMLLEALYKVLSTLAQKSPVVLYLRDVEGLVFKGPKTYTLFQKIIKKLSGPILILGSRLVESSLKQANSSLGAKLGALFAYNIDIKPPEDNATLIIWKSRLEEDMKAIQIQDNRNHISEVLSANDVECNDLASICFSDTILLDIEEIVVSAISHHLMNTEEPEYRGKRLVISSSSLAYGLSLFQTRQPDAKDVKLQLEASPEQDTKEVTTKTEGKNDSASAAKADAERTDSPKADVSKKVDADGVKSTSVPTPSKTPEVAPDNEFEKRIRPEVIPAGEVGVSFQDVGALEDVKEALQELVMLPLCRPELFNRGGLIKPCKGILLFGPPGTGKTMLAKAVATEAGASFINVSMSTITSKWFGEDEKNVRALFTLAAKVAPTVIFVDEVDSMLGQRSRVGEHEAMRKIKNEFMAHWDGLLTKPQERILVLAATNRPFDLDEAIIRRFERRIMVGLPNTQNREKILRAILAKENLAEDFDFTEIAVMTEGYSGSDLKNLCVTAAYRPIRELMKREQEEAQKKTTIKIVADQKPNEHSSDSRKNDIVDKNVALDVTQSGITTDSCNTCELPIRPLTMEDMRQAKTQISASYASEGTGMSELQQWNELYGEGGSRKKQQLTYFL